VPSPKALPTVAKDASATTASLSVSEEPDEKETPTVIRGKVTNRKGEPIAGAKIAAYSDLENEYLVASGEPSSSFSSVSKEDGTYEIAPCPSEPDGIVASHVDYANSIRHFETLPQVGKIEQDFVLDMGFKLRGQLTQVVDGKERAVAGQMIFICEEPAADSTLSFVRTVTDERGLFAFENCLYDRGYSVHTRVTSDIVLLNPPTIRVASGSRPQPLLLKLTEVGSLIGKVTDSAGNPVPEARVWPNRFGRAGLNNLRGRSEERDPREVITNGSGVFVLTGLALEFVYELKASAEGYPESVSGTVRAGDIPVEIVLKSPGELGVVRGKVVQGEDNAPVGGIELRLTSSGSDFIEKKTATDGDGSFEFTELADGMYYLSDPGPGLSPKEWAIQSIQSISISREQREVNLEVRALRSASIRGQVLSLETKIPVRGASLYANHPVLTPPDAPGNQQYFITGPDGAFEVSGLLPGETRLSAKKDGMLFVPRPEETSEVGAEDEKMIVNLKEGESLSDVKLYLSQGGTITGVVVNHEGSLVANCPLSLFYKETSGHSGRDFSEDYPSRISTNSDGRFRYAGLSLSRVYRILTNPSREPGNHPFASSQDIELSDSQPRAEVRIQAEEPGSIEGTVTDNDGEPVGWKKVIAMRISPEESFSMGSHVRKEQSTDQRGRYVLEGLAPGKYSLDVNGGEDYKAARVADIEVKSGEKTSGVDLTLEKVSKENRITLRGTVVDAGGARLGDCVVTLNQDTVPGSGQTRTTRSGDFALTGVAAGKECDLRFELPIGSSDGRSWRFHSGAFTPSDKEEVFILPFNGVIRGRLLHVGTKSPVDNATIHLLTPDIKVGKGWKGIECRLHWTSGNGWRISGKTDMEGRFAFPKLPIAEGYAITIESSSAATKTIKDVAIGGDLETDLGDILLDPADAYTITLTDGRTLAPYIEGNEKALSVQAKNADGTSVEIRKRAGTKPGEFILESIPRDATSLELDSQRHLPLHLDINPASPEKNLGAYVLDPGQTVRGVLQGPNGEKVEAGFVHVEFGEHSRIQNVDSTGRFKMEGLPAGPAKCNASAWRNNGVNSWIPSPGNNASLPYIDIEILPGQDTVLDLKFPPF
jgi:protocatechuate 3,4-dioxygenase beta subunit